MHNIKYDKNLTLKSYTVFDHLIKDGSQTFYFRCFNRGPLVEKLLQELFKCINLNDFIFRKVNKGTPKVFQISAVYTNAEGVRIITPILPKFLVLYKNDYIFKFLINNLPYYANVMCRREYGITAEGMEFTSDRGLPWNVNGIDHFEVRIWNFNSSLGTIGEMHFIQQLIKGNHIHERFLIKYVKFLMKTNQEMNGHKPSFIQSDYHHRVYDYK